MARNSLSKLWLQAFAAGLMCILAGLSAPAARAETVYSDGTVADLEESCAAAGLDVVASETVAGYEADPSVQYPFVGSSGHVRAVMHNIGCQNDTVGFFFNLPRGVSFAISAATPVVCLIGKNDGSVTPQEVANTTTSGCSQTPKLDHYGRGYFFAFSPLASAPVDGAASNPSESGWYLEIRVPVTYSQPLDGISKPSTDRLTVNVTSENGMATAYQPLTVYAASSAAPQRRVLTAMNGIGNATSGPAETSRLASARGLGH